MNGGKLSQFIYSHSPSALRDRLVTAFSARRGKVKFGPKYHEYFADLDRTQWYGEQELQRLQDEKLRKLVHYCVEFVPFYRELFRRHGLQARDIGSAADLGKLPILDKSTVQANLGGLRSTLYRDNKPYRGR